MNKSWVVSANSASTDFPLNNLPYGVFRTIDGDLHCGVAIGDMIVDVTEMEDADLLNLPEILVFATGAWNDFMLLGADVWTTFRAEMTDRLADGSGKQAETEPFLVARSDVEMAMPFDVMEYTDFYAGRHHATNVGTMFRGPENALPPNWLHIPIGYNGRASSVVVSGTDICRPWGQLKPPTEDNPHFAPCRRWDFELEMGAIVGQGSAGPVSVEDADAMIFGYVLLNDWSARDIQAWEYQPLGPFQAKATATSISPWIVTAAALEPFRVSTPPREKELLPYLVEKKPGLFDIELQVDIVPPDGTPTTITRTNFGEMYYSAAQQLAHHTTSGCPMSVGDLLGSGTISGPEKGNRGSFLELSWGGKEPLTLETGETRSFIEDGDTITMRGHAQGDGFRIGFGGCSGKTLPAIENPYARE
jgi:fumarylacetoacetase